MRARRFALSESVGRMAGGREDRVRGGTADPSDADPEPEGGADSEAEAAAAAFDEDGDLEISE